MYEYSGKTRTFGIPSLSKRVLEKSLMLGRDGSGRVCVCQDTGSGTGQPRVEVPDVV